MRKNLLKSLVAGVALVAASAGAQAYDITIGSQTVSFDAIDWSSAGSAWSPNYNPLGGNGSTFDLYVQSSATALVLNNVTVYSFGATSPFELTLFAKLNETVDATSVNGTRTTEDYNLNSGTWTIYQDAAKNGNLLTGVGIADGTAILSGTFVGGYSGSFTLNTATTSGSGSETLLGYVNATPNGFVTPQPVGTTATTSLQFGRAATAAVPTGFSDGVGAGTDGSYNAATQLVLQADANQNFVPEPASMALVGLGLAGLSAVRRRK